MFPPTPAGGSIAALCCLQTAHEAEEEVAERKRVPPAAHRQLQTFLTCSSSARFFMTAQVSLCSPVRVFWCHSTLTVSHFPVRETAVQTSCRKQTFKQNADMWSETEAELRLMSRWRNQRLFGLKRFCLAWKMFRFDVFQTDFWGRTKGAMADQQEKVNQTTKRQTWSSKRLLPLSASTPAVVSVLRVSAGLRWWWC